MLFEYLFSLFRFILHHIQDIQDIQDISWKWKSIPLGCWLWLPELLNGQHACNALAAAIHKNCAGTIQKPEVSYELLARTIQWDVQS